MIAYIVKINGARVDEVVFLKPMTISAVIKALIKDGYSPKGLSVKVTTL